MFFNRYCLRGCCAFLLLCATHGERHSANGMHVACNGLLLIYSHSFRVESKCGSSAFTSKNNNNNKNFEKKKRKEKKTLKMFVLSRLFYYILTEILL